MDMHKCRAGSFHPAMKCLLLVLIGLAALASAAEARKPNIIHIFTDDQGYNDLGCFGSTKIKTPNIDRMAA